MKFLLVAINAKYIHSNPAVYSLRAFAGEENAEHIGLAEYTINQPWEEILADIYRKKPNAVGFSCYIWNWDYVRTIIPELHKVLPDTDIWLGGPEVTYDADKILEKYPCLAGIMVGEGEQTFKELLELYRERENEAGTHKGIAEAENIHGIKGLCLRDGCTGERELTELTQIPFLYSRENIDSFKNKIIYYESSRGCPYRCSYCLSSIDKKVRLRNIDTVKRELQFFLDNNVPQVKFVDRTFNCDHEHSIAVWQYIYEHDNGVTNFHFEISADILREDEIALLNKMRPGLVQLEIGVQSVNPDTLHAIQRVMNVDRLERIVDEIHSGGNIHQHLDLIAGLPYEDYDSFGKSFNRVYKMKPDQLQLGFLKVLKGSAMHDMAEKYGIKYSDNPPYEVLCTDWLGFDDVLKLKAVEEMVELYYNSSQYTHTIPFLVKKFDTPFAMFEALAAFYEEKGFFVNTPARAYRYDVLLEFTAKYDEANLQVYKELLTFDMYLRENLKSRPAFAADITEEARAYIRSFYKQEEKDRRFLPEYAAYDAKQLMRMTHLEPFTYSVWDAADPGIKQSCFALFDYNSRNPLTYEAKVYIIPKSCII